MIQHKENFVNACPKKERDLLDNISYPHPVFTMLDLDIGWHVV